MESVFSLLTSVPRDIGCVCIAAVAVLLLCLFQKRPTLPPKCEGFAAPGWNRVAEVFKRHVESGHQRGGGFAVYHKGQLVVDFVGGYADNEAQYPWDKTTLSCLYSATKGIGAIVIAILVDRGFLDYSSRVASYWPEFAVNGKESITVEQLLSTQAGLILLDEVYSLFDIIKNPEKIAHLLANARPKWKPGSKHGFHGLTMGLYMDQLVRRVDPQHRSLDQFFAEEVSRKFGIDCFIGLPKEENYRCARLQRLSPRFVLDLLMSMIYSTLVKDKNSYRNLAEIGKEQAEKNPEVWHKNPAFREIPCASTHGFATVTDLALLYGIVANGGRHENQMLLSSSAVEKLNEPLVNGIDSVIYINSTIGRGTMIMKSKDGHNIFGYPGYSGQAGFADPKHRLGWAYLSNSPSLSYFADEWKYLQLVEMVYETVTELEQQEATDLLRE